MGTLTMAKKMPDKPVASPYQPSEREVAAVKEHLRRRTARMAAPVVKIAATKGNTVTAAPVHADPRVWQVGLEQAFGTTSSKFAGLMLNGLLNIALRSVSDIDESALNGMLAALHGINPADEVEAMLAAQMVATHLAAMECLKQANLSQQTFEGRDMNLRHATKLSRTYTMQVETLKRYRSKGEQRVVVQHQHVNVTAEQAAVQVNGGANSPPGGRGMAPKPKDQPHAPEAPRSISYGPGAPMSCPDPVRGRRADSRR
jgi:hypothetical protein